MNEINSFTFYRDYYFLIDTMPIEDKRDLAVAILDYIFKDKIPEFEGHKKAIFNTLSHQLDLSKSNSKRRILKKPKKNRKETEKKPKQNKTSILSFKFYISNLNNKDIINNLFNEYLELRKKKKYTLTETVINRLVNKCNEYGKTDEEKIEIITNAINGAWKDFYPISKKKAKEPIPEWFDKDIKKEEVELTDEQRKELEQFKKELQTLS